MEVLPINLSPRQHQDDIDTIEETVNFGPNIGDIKVFQFSGSAFNSACSSSNSNANDCTGCRVYSGMHVEARFLACHSELVNDKKVVEIGCGTGLLGISVCLASRPASMVLTDGNARSITLTNRNLSRHNLFISASARVFQWSTHRDFGETFDVVIASELMYYKTDIPLLVATVTRLLNEDGLFLHAHLFRRDGQEEEFISALEEIGWSTLEAPVTQFISLEELGYRVDWYRVRCLISGPMARVSQLKEQYPDWSVFLGEQVSDDEV